LHIYITLHKYILHTGSQLINLDVEVIKVLDKKRRNILESNSGMLEKSKRIARKIFLQAGTDPESITLLGSWIVQLF